MSEIEVIGINGWGKIEFKFSFETNDDGNGATFSNDDGMFIHTDFEPRLSLDGYEIPLGRLRELAAAEREGRVEIVPKCEECRFNEKGKYADRCFFEDGCIGRSCYNSFAPIETEAAEAALVGKGE